VIVGAGELPGEGPAAPWARVQRDPAGPGDFADSLDDIPARARHPFRDGPAQSSALRTAVGGHGRHPRFVGVRRQPSDYTPRARLAERPTLPTDATPQGETTVGPHARHGQLGGRELGLVRPRLGCYLWRTNQGLRGSRHDERGPPVGRVRPHVQSALRYHAARRTGVLEANGAICTFPE